MDIIKEIEAVFGAMAVKKDQIDEPVVLAEQEENS